jgi:hypothetical protein
MLNTITGFLLDCVISEHSTTPSIQEVYIKEEPIDDAVASDAVASTSQEQHMGIKREEVIDIKHEPITSDDKDHCLDLVSFHPCKLF